jgi:hypothetical protein
MCCLFSKRTTANGAQPARLANTKLRAGTLRILPEGDEERAWREGWSPSFEAAPRDRFIGALAAGEERSNRLLVRAA